MKVRPNAVEPSRNDHAVPAAMSYDTQFLKLTTFSICRGLLSAASQTDPKRRVDVQSCSMESSPQAISGLRYGRRPEL